MQSQTRPDLQSRLNTFSPFCHDESSPYRHIFSGFFPPNFNVFYLNSHTNFLTRDIATCNFSK